MITSRWKRKLHLWRKNNFEACSLPFAVNLDTWRRAFSSTSSLLFEQLMPLGCFTSCITFKAFIISEDWWWPSDRRADSSISCRSRTGQSRLFTSLGNELSFRRQPRFQQDELQSLVTRWNGLLKAAFILKDPRSLLETDSVSPVSNLSCQPLHLVQRTEIQTGRERAIFWVLRCQESTLHPQPLVVFQEGKDLVMGTEDKRGYVLIMYILFWITNWSTGLTMLKNYFVQQAHLLGRKWENFMKNSERHSSVK